MPRKEKQVVNKESSNGEVQRVNSYAPSKEEAAKGQDPVNNGGRTDKYIWTQTLKDVSMDIWLPKGTAAKQLLVEMRPSNLKVSIKSTGKVVLEGTLDRAILVDEGFWTVEDDILSLTMAKKGQMEWWRRVLKGDPKIDADKIEPENSSVHELDGDIRQSVEKMMHDQKLKAQGLPTTDEKKNMDLLEKFKKAHPEMDFSQCKFS
mmetsp:Transcript_8966/g.14177  ORF Transcript_8966/g.14177 Transcript_8966/m.14177 type:complete len:205 (+) Transcript_8966:604-1218(+)